MSMTIDRAFLHKFTLLYVEDDEMIRENLKMMLGKVFDNILVAKNGKEGLDIFFKHQEDHLPDIDLVISDINMPQVSGITMIKKMREFDSEIPAIFTTAYTDTKYLLDAITLHIDYYAIKPVNVKELVINIQKILVRIDALRLLKHQKDEIEQYKSIIDDNTIVSETDKQGNIVYANKKFCKISKFSQSELIGKSHSIIKHPDMPAYVFKGLWDTVTSGETWKSVVMNMDHEGEAYYLDVAVFPIFDRYENITGYKSIAFEIEEKEWKGRKFY
jgi:PAS domain S-box-containing protein